MARLVHKRSRKTGLPPGTLIHIGEQKTETTKIQIFEYDGEVFRERATEKADDCLSLQGPPLLTWINVSGIHQVEILEKVGNCLGLHPLILEDVLNTDQRPKVEDYGEDLFLVLKTLSFDEKTEEISAEQVSLILRPHMLITFQEKEGPLFAPIQERIRSGKGRLRKMGVDYLAYSLLDMAVDHYFVTLEKVGERIEVLEGRLVNNPGTPTLQRIQKLKRDMALLRKWVWPLREILTGLEKGGYAAIQPSTRLYLRDVYDHTIQIMDTIEILRDMLSGMLDIYLSSLNNRMSGVMKVLTVIATIFMPLTFLAGVYGMNFKEMPGLESRWGFLLILFFMAAIAVFMVVLFRRKKWL